MPTYFKSLGRKKLLCYAVQVEPVATFSIFSFYCFIAVVSFLQAWNQLSRLRNTWQQLIVVMKGTL